MVIDINDVAGIGSVADTPSFMLPPETWSEALNMRAIDGGLEALLGWNRPYTVMPPEAPHFLFPVSALSLTYDYWLSASLGRVFVPAGPGFWADITRASGIYSTPNTEAWNGTNIGGVPILNNGVDVPQFWGAPDPAVKLADLTNWPAGLRAKVVRGFGPFLVAVSITDAGNALPHTIQWSHPANPGNIPPTWDYADPATDAGRRDFPDVSSGMLREAMPLGQTLYIYKDSSTWKMRFVGGRLKFDFGESAWLTTSGILAPRCVTVTGDGQRQVVVTQDDVIWHNGNQVTSILNRRQRRRLFAELDSEHYGTSFLYTNHRFREVRFCYPTSGNLYPNKELIMNYGEADSWVVTEADGVTYRNAAVGLIPGEGLELWDPPVLEDMSDTWETDTGSWEVASLFRRGVLLAAPDLGAIYKLDAGIKRDGKVILSRLRREGIAFLGKKRSGAPIVDFQTEKMLTRVWPKITKGGVRVTFGAQTRPDGPTYWSETVGFDPNSQVYADSGPVSGRAVSIKFEAEVMWRIDGYKINVETLGTMR